MSTKASSPDDLRSDASPGQLQQVDQNTSTRGSGFTMPERQRAESCVSMESRSRERKADPMRLSNVLCGRTISPIGAANDSWCNYLTLEKLTGIFNLFQRKSTKDDIELGADTTPRPEPSTRTSQTISNHDGTVADPEPYHTIKHQPKPKKPKRTAEERRARRHQLIEKYWFTDGPPFLDFIRMERVDLVTMLIFTLVPLIMHFTASVATTHLFVLSNGGRVASPEYAYPYQSEYITT
jgi:hypothetical protein